MNKITNNTQLVVIFERINIEGTATMFYPVDVVTGHINKENKTFVSDNGEEYQYILTSKDNYGFALRNKIGIINQEYKEKKLNKILERHLNGLQHFGFYFTVSNNDQNQIELVCQDVEENTYIINDRDLESYKKHMKKEQTKPVNKNVNTKELINEVKKKVIGQDNAIEDIVSIMWQNSKSKRKQNMLLVGPTGVGKTEITRIIAKKLDIPLVTANAASLTQSGYKGDSIEDVLRELLIECNNDVKKAENAIIVIDEIDKLVGSLNSGNDVATTGVQDELLKLVEDGTYTINMSTDFLQTNNIKINTKNITFIGLGAFSEILKQKQEKKEVKKIGFGQEPSIKKTESKNITTDDLVKYGLKSELVGRFTNIIELNPLTKENLIQIMKNPNEDLIKDKINLLNSLGIKVDIKDSVYEKLANIAIKKNTGARGLIGSVDNLFVKAMSEVSQNDGIYETLTIDENTIDNPKNYTLTKKKTK